MESSTMAGARYWVLALLLISPSFAFAGKRELNRLNRTLAGRVVDFTHNHGEDRRIESAILCQKRDLYVYLPPGYTPEKAYPFVFWFHGAFGDEIAFIRGAEVAEFDRQIQQGCIPPMIMAAPDGTYSGKNNLLAQHSFYVNGQGGCVEDHIMREVVPFLMSNFSIRPEREAHGTTGISAGGLGAMVLAIKHRDFFGTCAVLGAPVNLRYWNCQGRYFANFDPRTYRWRTVYKPREVNGRFFFCLLQLRSRWLVEKVFGPRAEVLDNIAANNPADLLITQNVQPGELNLFIDYPRWDNFNFDAQNQSFAWLAEQRGIEVTVVEHRGARHRIPYFERSHPELYLWLGKHLLPPTAAAPALSISQDAECQSIEMAPGN
jgi:S-formylglutathione hydrolase FrmB